MDELNPFEDIAPYNDEEAAAALSKLAEHPNVPWISKYIFSNQPETYLRDILRSISTVDDFQKLVMSKATEWVLEKSVHNFSYDGINKLKSIEGKFLAMSNHRDIILDPAFTQLILFRNQVPLTEICVGDNLLKSKTIERLIRSNRMIKVIRGISARELYLSSQVLSKYIRESITTGKSSVWIAQRQGRTKDGVDITEQGLLKMFDMSGTKDFVQNFLELNIIPLSISYEYEPCDILKAREILISRTQKYVKTENEDLQSIMLGPLPAYPTRRGRPRHQRLQALEYELHRLRPGEPYFQVRGPLHPRGSGSLHGIHRAPARPGGTDAEPRRTPRHLPPHLRQPRDDEGKVRSGRIKKSDPEGPLSFISLVSYGHPAAGTGMRFRSWGFPCIWLR